MHASKTSKTLTASITTKLTPKEESLIKQQAQMDGLRPSEWCRRALMNAVECPPEMRLVLSEVLSVRKVFLALMLDLIQGQKPTESRIREVIDNAEATKFSMAENRINSFRSNARNESK
jgi:hypothetical protein